MRANENQVIKNLAVICKSNPAKADQLRKVGAITMHLTSDDHINVKVELYRNHIVRYLIEGTRCNMTCTLCMDTMEIVRKPRGEKPWADGDCDFWVCDVLKLL